MKNELRRARIAAHEGKFPPRFPARGKAVRLLKGQRRRVVGGKT